MSVIISRGRCAGRWMIGASQKINFVLWLLPISTHSIQFNIQSNGKKNNKIPLRFFNKSSNNKTVINSLTTTSLSY